MNEPILQLRDLTIRYSGMDSDAVHNVSLNLEHGESVGLIGESGSGKSSLALAVMGLLDKNVQITGSIYYKGVNLLELTEREMEYYRWKKIAIVFQNSLDVFNPVLTIGEQISEGILKHLGGSKTSAMERARVYLEMVGLEPSWAEAYPHQLSGGMRQKALIAMALSCEPEMLLVDEPTMALDSVSKQETIRLLMRLREKEQFAMLVISHELPVIAEMTSRVFVMCSGHILEEGPTQELLKNPLHTYTRGLIYSSPAINPYRDMWGISGEDEHPCAGICPFYSRCNQRIARCAYEPPILQSVGDGRRVSCLRGGIVTLLRGNGLSKVYKTRKKTVEACRGCDIQIRAGEVCALIGQTGSGKTTLAEILSGLIEPDSGRVEFDGQPVNGNSATSKISGIQMVFQDPLTATNDRLTIEEIVREPLDIAREQTKSERIHAVKDALKNVQLNNDDDFLAKRGFMLSGGQRQRVAVARALIMRPKLLIADEISAMLDPSTTANLLRLLKGLQNREGFAMLYITHDLALAQKISDKVYVMYKGAIIEKGPVEDVLRYPKEEYTKSLLRDNGAISGMSI